MLKAIFFTGLLILPLITTFAAEDSVLYKQAVVAARQGEINLAFINFYRIINLYPESPFFDEALFGAGEYYFSVHGYSDAAEMFSSYVYKYPHSKIKLFALVYLFKMATAEDNEDIAKRLKKEIVTFQQLSFIFRDSKIFSYHSPLGKRYKAVYFIDKVEFYIDEVLFAEVRY
jgi:outer membrane protein assembly factor BamD (BamD/ComL family)